MHAFDFILILFSFVYAAAVVHVLAVAGEIIIAAKRIRLSWLNAGWMLAALLFTCAWWIGLWDLHTRTVWDVGSIALFFAIAAGIYLEARLVSPRIPETGEIDLQKFHAEEGRKYLRTYGILMIITAAVNAGLGQGELAAQWPEQNLAIVPMAFATTVAIYIRTSWIQAAAVAIQIGGWIWYFAKLQTPLAG